jgi:hypothetical protein
MRRFSFNGDFVEEVPDSLQSQLDEANARIDELHSALRRIARWTSPHDYYRSCPCPRCTAITLLPVDDDMNETKEAV